MPETSRILLKLGKDDINITKVHHGWGDQQGKGAVQYKEEGLLGRGGCLQVAQTRVHGMVPVIGALEIL